MVESSNKTDKSDRESQVRVPVCAVLASVQDSLSDEGTLGRDLTKWPLWMSGEDYPRQDTEMLRQELCEEPRPAFMDWSKVAGRGQWETGRSRKQQADWVGFAHVSEGSGFILWELGVTAGFEKASSGAEHHDSVVILGGEEQTLLMQGGIREAGERLCQ